MNNIILAISLAVAVTPVPATAAASAAAPSAQVQPTRFSVEVVGKGPDLILIPGLSSTRDVWRATAERLMATHRVHLVQLRGFGEPAGPNASGPVLQPLVDDLAAYVRRERLPAPAIVGHSMGGLAALMLAADHPGLAGRVMVVDAFPFIGPVFGADSVAALTPQATSLRDMMVKQAATAVPDFSLKADCPASLPAPKTPSGNMSNSGSGACLIGHGARVSDLRVVGQALFDDMVTDLRPRLAAVTTPVTMLYPQDDRLLAKPAATKLYNDAFADLRGVKLVPISGSYHFIMQDQPTAFAAALDAFLR